MTPIVDRARGATDLPLSQVGALQAEHLGQRIAAKGGVDSIISSRMQRALATAHAIARHNPGSRLAGVTDKLDPWHQGRIEGTPSDRARPIIQYFAHHQNEPIPGLGKSGIQGESLHAAAQRAIPFIIHQLRSLKPGERKLLSGHNSLIRMLDGWIKRGAPKDLSIDPQSMTDKHDSVEPGGLVRVGIHNGKLAMRPVNTHSDDRELDQGQLLISRHGATPWSQDSAQSIPDVLRRLQYGDANTQRGGTLS